jgi:hypothetical protein
LDSGAQSHDEIFGRSAEFWVAIGTLALAAVTTGLAGVTYRLVRSTDRELDVIERQAKASTEQASASAEQAVASQRSNEIARASYDAQTQPLLIEVREGDSEQFVCQVQVASAEVSVTLLVRNVGPGPARITGVLLLNPDGGGYVTGRTDQRSVPTGEQFTVSVAVGPQHADFTDIHERAEQGGPVQVEVQYDDASSYRSFAATFTVRRDQFLRAWLVSRVGQELRIVAPGADPIR